MKLDYILAYEIFTRTYLNTKQLVSDGTLVEMIANSPNLHKMRYTYLHRKAIFNLADKFGIDKNLLRLHDTDKYFMYLWIDEPTTRECHKTLNLHHHYHIPQCLPKNVFIEMMLDWESARFSKPDKPLNAYETLNKWMPHVIAPYMEPFLKEYGLYHICNESCITEEAYKVLSESVTPEMIVQEIIDVINRASD